MSRDGPKHEGGPLKNLKGKALTEVPTIVFDCAYVGSSVEAPSPRWWGAKWHQRWHMTSLKLEFNIYRGANHPIWNWILESIAFSIILGWLERVGCPCRIKYRSFLNFLAPFWDHFGTIFRPDWDNSDNFETIINQFGINLWPFMTIFWSIFETLGDLLDTSFGAKIQIFVLWCDLLRNSSNIFAINKLWIWNIMPVFCTQKKSSHPSKCMYCTVQSWVVVPILE